MSALRPSLLDFLTIFFAESGLLARVESGGCTTPRTPSTPGFSRKIVQKTGSFHLNALLMNTPEEKFAETAMELCCNILGDMIVACESAVEMQHRFPTLIGAKALTARDRYDIATADLWIHGDDHLFDIVPELQEAQRQEFECARAAGMSPEEIEEKYGKPIPDWTLESTQEERAFMSEVPQIEPNPQNIVRAAFPVNDRQVPDPGCERNHHWWG